MKKSQELREQRAKLWDGARAILDKAEAEKRELTGEENTQYDKIVADIDSKKAEIDRYERAEQLEGEMRESTGRKAATAHEGEDPAQEIRKNATPEYKKAFRSFLAYGASGLNSEERNILASGKATLTESEQRALAAGTGSSGGYTVPQGFRDILEEAQKWYGGIRSSRATIMKTATGNPLPMPTENDTTNIGELVSESSPVSTADPSFGQKIINAYKFSSKTVLVSLELLQDSAFDIESYIARKLGIRLGRAQNNYFTVGTGTNQPSGAVTGATLGKTGTAGQTTSIIYEDLVDLEHSIDPAYRPNAEWMFHDSTLKVLKKLKDNYGRPLWLPSIVAGAPDEILNHPYVVNNDMPIMAASAKSVLFGDMSKFLVRDVLDVTLFRIAEKYIESGQVGFLAFTRNDSALLDAGTHPVAYYANSAT